MRFQRIDIGKRFPDIPRFHWQQVLLGFFPQEFFNQADEIEKLNRLVMADIEKTVRAIHDRYIGKDTESRSAG